MFSVEIIFFSLSIMSFSWIQIKRQSPHQHIILIKVYKLNSRKNLHLEAKNLLVHYKEDVEKKTIWYSTRLNAKLKTKTILKWISITYIFWWCNKNGSFFHFFHHKNINGILNFINLNIYFIFMCKYALVMFE